MVSDEGSGNTTTYSQDDIDALAYSYVLSHGYEGALAMLDQFIADRVQEDVGTEDVVAILCRRILDAIHDEAVTISRLLDRMIGTLHNGAHHPMAAVAFPDHNPIDRHIGDRLRQRRSELGMSLTRLAADLALTPDALALIEDGAARLDAVVFKRAVKRLDVPAAYFFQLARPHQRVGSGSQELNI
jgi:hypothetical protein